MLRSRVDAACRAVTAAAAVLMVLGGSGCGSGSAPSSVSAAVPADRPLPAPVTSSIWFHPMPAAAAWPNGPTSGVGSTDFLSLFAANAPWSTSLAHTSVIGLYAGWVAQATDADLHSVVNFINAHGLGIELESPSLQATASCGTGVEGYVAYGDTIDGVTLQYLQRLKAFGGKLSFVKIDEPLYFGSFVADPRSCHLSLTHVAQQVGAFVAIVKSVYPDAVVGDIEPIIAGVAYTPDVVTALGQWQDAYAHVNGAALPFFIADTDFSNPSWPALVKSIETATRARGVRFGMLYMGDPSDTTDAQWTAKAVSRFRTYELDNGGKPDYALFQSWMQQPKHTLPETDPTSFTGALAAYVAAHT